ncbi:MAG: diaminopimelate decarboxylase [Actinobacteria bacterium]|nr:diaminopimelate decarboxylase [Actinomycetota bacterium]MBU1943393.1 diaminopimelate decarboxylase [Actinomycetota bacterium]MBU2686750.1 diaminopimelate decarboxylase [Actinomycetota bacterium]
MNDFVYRDGVLYCEELKVSDIAAKVGTPFYLYSKNTFTSHLQHVEAAFGDLAHIVCYSVKANSNVAILSMMAREGAGADVVSGGELYRALKAGMDPQKIVFAGLGKTEQEIEYGLSEGILMFNVESSQELMLVNDVAQRLGTQASIALRVNPDIDAKTHPYIATGLKQSKFGIPLSQAMAEYEVAQKLPGLNPTGVHQHIGSQILEPGPFEASLRKVTNLAKSLKVLGLDIRYINIGGGFGIQYTDEDAPEPEQFAAGIVPILKETGCTAIMEVGRMIAGNAGILVTKVLLNKQGEDKRFVVVDAAMNDLIRPSLYQANHHIGPVVYREGAAEVKVDVVGPICESGDFLAQDRAIPEVQSGELLAVFTAGAYGFTMSSNYNSRTRLPEVLVSGRRAFVIRRRETYEDLVRGEAIPKDL